MCRSDDGFSGEVRFRNKLFLCVCDLFDRHFHTEIADTFYVLEGEMRLFLQNPKQEVRLKPGETYTAVAKRPHLVTNAGKTSLTFLVLQGMGDYDYVPMV